MLYTTQPNQTTTRDGIRHELFSKYPTEYEMMEADEDELSEILKPLGLYRRRAKTLIKFSWMWVNGFTDVMENMV